MSNMEAGPDGKGPATLKGQETKCQGITSAETAVFFECPAMASTETETD